MMTTIRIEERRIGASRVYELIASLTAKAAFIVSEMVLDFHQCRIKAANEKTNEPRILRFVGRIENGRLILGSEQALFG